MANEQAAADCPDEIVLGSSDQVRVARRSLPGGGTVVVKRALGVQAVRRLHAEMAVLQHLVDAPGVVKLAALPTESDSLCFVDNGSVATSVYLQSHRFTVSQVVAYGHSVARTLAGVHAAGVIHRDVCPANILVHPLTFATTLIDFNIAKRVAVGGAVGGAMAIEPLADQAQPEDEAQGGIAGTLPYISPEQTGRTGRVPDARSDLYSLGITLWELCTGRKPFESTDLLDLVHDHLVRLPEAPAVVNPEVPPILSALILRLLEKEPDHRYQSAQGLALDLARIAESLDRGDMPAFELGRHDFGKRLNPPAQLLGIDAARQTLTDAVSAVLAPQASGGSNVGVRTARRNPNVLIVGPMGVGKSSLLAELRPWVSARRGWLLPAKFDPFRRDIADGMLAALRALGRQLLAEPEQALAVYRTRIRDGLGRNLGVGPTLLPEFTLLLGDHPAVELTNPREAEARTVQATLAILRGVASVERPVVLVLDDLQHAPDLALKLLDALATSEEPVPNLCLVSAYREKELAGKTEAGEATGEPPLRALLTRWETLDLPAQHVALNNLDERSARDLVAAVLHMTAEEATSLAAVVAERTQHNPYATIELLNALRQDGLLTLNDAVGAEASAAGWQWNAQAIRRHVGDSSVDDLLGRRIARLPESACDLLVSLSCLGGTVETATMAAAAALTREALLAQLAPAFDDGLLLPPTAEGGALQFVHGRVKQAVLDTVPQAQRTERHLRLARRLAAQPGADMLAAEQYLRAAPLVVDATECRTVAALLRRAAEQLGPANSAAAEPMLDAAIQLLEASGGQHDHEALFELRARQHVALFGAGRLEAGDAAYARMLQAGVEVLELAEPTRMQIYSLMLRNRYADACDLGLGLLEQLGLARPPDMPGAIAAGVQRLVQWSASPDKQADHTRPEITDARLLACGSLMAGISVSAFFCNPSLFAWTVTEAHRIWCDHGPAESVLSSMCSVPFLLMGAPQDYRGAHDASRHLIAVGEARGYEPATSRTRCVYGLAAGHWVQSAESVVQDLHRAREELTAFGELAYVGFSYLAADMLLDVSDTLDAAADEIDKCLAYAKTSGNGASLLRFRIRRQLVRALRGQTRAPNTFTDADFDEDAFVNGLAPTDTTLPAYYTMQSMLAAVCGDLPRLLSYTASAMPVLARLPGCYMWCQAYVARGLALSMQALTLPHAERAALISELDNTSLKWFQARAADAPANFLHLLRWLQAERAWIGGTVWEAGQAFDAAVAEARLHPRPWHLALILERAALFRLAHGMEADAAPLLLEACERYESWGALGKVRELKRTHRGLRGGTTQRIGATMVSAEVVDMMAILRASQTLSSETNLQRLTQKMSKVLGSITGATGVRLIVRAEEGSSTWVMADTLVPGAAPVTVEQAGAEGEIPLSAFRYAERMAQTLVIDDVASDERFAADPFVQKFAHCSLLLLPVMKALQLKAMLVLENNQRRNAFDADRLDAVSLIAGQLSVSLDNALLYASLEQRVAERTAQLRQKTNDINAMLQNMPQGVLTVMGGGSIHPEYSAYLQTIFETADIAGRPVMQLVFAHSNLSADVQSQVEAAIGSMIGEDAMNFEFNAHLLATELDVHLPSGRTKSLALDWSAITDDAGIMDKLMLCVRDVTDLKRLTAEANSRKRELQIIGEVLAVSQEKFHEFIDSARGFIADNQRLIAADHGKIIDTVDVLFRNMHTLKGNARTHGLMELASEAHGAEQAYDELRKNHAAAWEVERLLTDLRAVSESLEHYAHVNDVVLGRKGPGRRGTADKFAMVEHETLRQLLYTLAQADRSSLAALQTTLEQVADTLNLIGTESLADILQGSLASLPSLAKELGKAAPQVHIEDHGIVVRSQATGLLKNLFTHLLRNALDHGLESPEQRRAVAKPEAGRIDIELGVRDSHLCIVLRDDGRGLALGKIRQKAAAQGLLTRVGDITDHEVAQLIFRSGFSTAEQVTEISGRGVGMDAVRNFLEREGGDIAIRLLDQSEIGYTAGSTSADYVPFETVIRMPDKFAASLSAEQALAKVRGSAPISLGGQA